MTLVSSGTYREQYATDYKYIFNINCLNDFNKVMEYDHTASLFKNNHRANENFINSNCIMLDFDNGALSVDDFSNEYKDIEWYLATSKSHNKEKNGKTEPRYHIYLPIPLVDDYEKYSLMIISAQEYFKTADTACKNPSRFFNGNNEADRITKYNNGKCILYFIKDIYNQLKEKKQKEETRYNENMFINTNEKWLKYINKVLINEDLSVGNRNNVLTSIAGLCKKHNFSIDALYYANTFIGLGDREFNNIVKLFNRG
jgi:hypothetical protein